MFALALVVGWVHTYATVDAPNLQHRAQFHASIIADTAPAPYRYRVLVPFTVEAGTRLWFGVGSADSSPRYPEALAHVFRLYDLLAVWFSLWALYALFKVEFDGTLALIGALFAGGVFSLPLRDHFYQPWSLLEPGMVALGLLWAVRNNWPRLAALIAVATLNREATVAIVVGYAALEVMRLRNGHKPTRAEITRSALRVFGLLAIWAVIFLGLVFIRGRVPTVRTRMELLAFNLEPGNIADEVQALVLFASPLVVFLIAGWRRAPRSVKWSAWMIPVMLVGYIFFGRWNETRVLMPLYPLLIPFGLAWLSATSAQTRESSVGPS